VLCVRQNAKCSSSIKKDEHFLLLNNSCTVGTESTTEMTSTVSDMSSKGFEYAGEGFGSG